MFAPFSDDVLPKKDRNERGTPAQASGGYIVPKLLDAICDAAAGTISSVLYGAPSKSFIAIEAGLWAEPERKAV